MIPVTELTMAANSTFTSIISEIQLSNLNFNIKMTPFGAYITLKKTVQKDLHGNHATPSPPLLLVLHRAHQEIRCLQEEKSRLETALHMLEKDHEQTLQENERLVKSFEEGTEVVENVTATNNKLKTKIEIIEKEAVKNRAEIKNYESKLKELRKKHLEAIKEDKAEMKTLKNEKKSKEKEIYDLTRNVEISRVKIKNYKSEISGLKISKSKLEAEVRKLGKEKMKKESADINANSSRSKVTEPVTFSNALSHSFTTSLVTHWNPHLIKPFQEPSDISSMVTHCATSPPPGCSLVAMSEVLEALNKAVERLSESMKRWDSS